MKENLGSIIAIFVFVGLPLYNFIDDQFINPTIWYDEVPNQFLGTYISQSDVTGGTVLLITENSVSFDYGHYQGKRMEETGKFIKANYSDGYYRLFYGEVHEDASWISENRVALQPTLEGDLKVYQIVAPPGGEAYEAEDYKLYKRVSY